MNKPVPASPAQNFMSASNQQMTEEVKKAMQCDKSASPAQISDEPKELNVLMLDAISYLVQQSDRENPSSQGISLRVRLEEYRGKIK